jgi:hypothetical protein
MSNEGLLGVDVGFSERRKTTGLAWFTQGQIGVAVVGTSWAERESALPSGVRFTRIALDAPLLPSEALRPRPCEAVFYGRPFWNRCRPGLSHHGRGLLLRNAGKVAGAQFASLLTSRHPVHDVIRAPAIEAFPNAFLGVLTNEQEFRAANLSRRHRSDWLYGIAVRSGAFKRILQRLGWCDPAIEKVIINETDHDKRAALVCLMTAALADRLDATAIGDPAGGGSGYRPFPCGSIGRGKERLLPATGCDVRDFPSCVFTAVTRDSSSFPDGTNRSCHVLRIEFGIPV